MVQAMADCGCRLNNAYMQHSLLALVVIPEIRISDHGLIDVTKFEKQRRRDQAEEQRDREPLEDRIEQDHRRPDHRRDSRQQDRLEAHGTGLEQHVHQRLARVVGVADEVDQQDRVAHDDAGERDEADHRGGRERRAEQPVAEDDPDEGQRHRRQHHERHLERAELRHDEDVDRRAAPP
jgi:hypothetical protein